MGFDRSPAIMGRMVAGPAAVRWARGDHYMLALGWTPELCPLVTSEVC